MIVAPALDLREVLVVEFDPEPGARPAQEIEKLDSRQTEHRGRLTGGDTFIGVKLERSLFLNRTNEVGFGALDDGAVGDLKLNLQLHGTFIVPP